MISSSDPERKQLTDLDNQKRENRVDYPVPIACDMMAIPADQRASHEALAKHLVFEAALEYRELPNGYALRFSVDNYLAINQYIANERLCCPFFHFILEVTPGHGPIWLHLTGGEPVKEYLKAELHR